MLRVRTFKIQQFEFFQSFLKFDICHVAPLRIEISFFRRIYIYIYTTWIYIYVRQVSLVLFLCKLSHELRVALTLTYLPEFVLI